MDPADLDALIARIPTKERRIAWATAAKSTFTEQQLDDARAKVGAWARVMDAQLARTPFLLGDAYSLADLVAFANFWGLPRTVPEQANEETVPHYIAWLRHMHARPASRQLFGASRSLGRMALELGEQLNAVEPAL